MKWGKVYSLQFTFERHKGFSTLRLFDSLTLWLFDSVTQSPIIVIVIVIVTIHIPMLKIIDGTDVAVGLFVVILHFEL